MKLYTYNKHKYLPPCSRDEVGTGGMCDRLGGTPSSRITCVLSQNFRVCIYMSCLHGICFCDSAPRNSLTSKHACNCIVFAWWGALTKQFTYVTVNNFKHSKHTYIDHQIQHSSNWHRLWRGAGDGCPILTDIQSSTRQASNRDRVVTLRHMVQVGTLTESIWCHGIQYNVMEFYELCTKVCILEN